MSKYNHHTPKTIAIVKWLLFLRIISVGFIFLLGCYLVMQGSDLPPFLEGVKDEMFSVFEMDRHDSFSFNIGMLIGALFLPLVLLTLQLLLVRQSRSYPMLLFLVILGVILTVARGQLPILSLIILGLLSLKESRDYFIQKEELLEEKRVDILDDF